MYLVREETRSVRMEYPLLGQNAHEKASEIKYYDYVQKSTANTGSNSLLRILFS